ncbi:MAG TPA: transcriptional regulator Spx [Acholeplasmataceae bacterium]|jgi:regulatory protein spx|nr:transcriptional regulator Spx [Acholeplasmataceae bacterium]HQC30778.1 transcriptional regulator Spx [Acholeplasmataceae bacterium]
MITIYTTPSCSSCRKAKKWLDDHRIPYSEKNIFNENITEDDLDLMLEHSQNGFEDIISTRSKIIRESDIDLDGMRTNELKRFILDNPSVLKRPIMIDPKDNKMQVGYNDEEIRVFIPKRLRELIMYSSFSQGDFTYQKALEIYFEEMESRPDKSDA